MASGFGMRGGPGRCHEFWVDFSKCMQGSDDPRADCWNLREDYMECLHHKKEYTRNRIISEELKKKGGIPPPEEPVKTPESSQS